MTILAALLLSLLFISSGYAQTIPEGFYVHRNWHYCFNESHCTIEFVPVPADKFLMIGHVSCHIGAEKVPIFTLMIRGWDNLDTYLKPLEIGATSTQRYIQSSDQLTMIVPSGVAPTIVLNFTARTNATLNCVITGQLKP